MSPLDGTRRLWRRLGPGILLAATAIGASHLVMAPQAGALFGVALLWLVPLCHLAKYPAFEFGPRYAAARGESLLRGYARVPGPRGWALWAFLISTVLQGAGVLAGVVGIAGSVLATYTGRGDDTTALSVVLLLVVLALLRQGGFRWLDNLNKTMMAILVLATILAAFIQPPPAGTLRGLVVPSLPAGALALAAAMLGWMPTGIDVSVWHSLWTLEKERHLVESGELDGSGDRAKRLALALSDMRLGYGLSVIVALIFVILGAAHLDGQGQQLLGAGFSRALAEVYRSLLGGWMYHLFFVSAFFAMFSTSYTVIDGFSRAFSETLALLRPGLADRRQALYAGFAEASALVAAITLITVGNPVTLVLAVALISLGFAPVLYGLNLWCVVTQIEDPALRPSRPLIVLGALGTLFMAGAAGLYLWVKGPALWG